MPAFRHIFTHFSKIWCKLFRWMHDRAHMQVHSVNAQASYVVRQPDFFPPRQKIISRPTCVALKRTCSCGERHGVQIGERIHRCIRVTQSTPANTFVCPFPASKKRSGDCRPQLQKRGKNDGIVNTIFRFFLCKSIFRYLIFWSAAKILCAVYFLFLVLIELQSPRNDLNIVVVACVACQRRWTLFKFH